MQAGLLWTPYQDAYRPYIKADEHEKLKKVPADLDLTPDLDDRWTSGAFEEGNEALMARRKYNRPYLVAMTPARIQHPGN